jgi:group I intron endonuclease
MGFIYIITNDINDKKYIGLTSGTVAARWAKHCRNADSGVDYAIYRAMRAHGIEHFSISTIEEEPNFCILCEREQYWINFYDTYNKGYNETLGGEGNRKYTLETIYTLWDSGLTIGQIAEQLSCARSTVYSSLLSYSEYSVEESIFRRSDSLKKRPVQFDINGRYIAAFDSEEEACLAVGASMGSVGLCCNSDKHCTVKGYIWLWESDVERISDVINDLRKTRRRSTPDMQAVAQIDSTGNIIAIFENAKEAAIAFGKTRDSHIGECCRGKRNTCFGFSWRFLNDIQNLGG